MYVRQGNGGVLELGPNPPRFVFLDIESTGLDVETVDEPWEIAWITDDCVKRHFFVGHETTPSNWVLKHGGYSRFYDRDKNPSLIGVQVATWQSILVLLASDCLRLENESEAAADANDGDRAGAGKPHLVGACPTLDDRILRRGYKREAAVPYHYHLIDVEALALGALWGRYGAIMPSIPLVPPHLADLRRLLGIPGDNPHPHAADYDAEEAKYVFEWLIAGAPEATEEPKGLQVGTALVERTE